MSGKKNSLFKWLVKERHLNSDGLDWYHFFLVCLVWKIGVKMFTFCKLTLFITLKMMMNGLRLCFVISCFIL